MFSELAPVVIEVVFPTEVVVLLDALPVVIPTVPPVTGAVLVESFPLAEITKVVVLTGGGGGEGITGGVGKVGSGVFVT